MCIFTTGGTSFTQRLKQLKPKTPAAKEDLDHFVKGLFRKGVISEIGSYDGSKSIRKFATIHRLKRGEMVRHTGNYSRAALRHLIAIRSWNRDTAKSYEGEVAVLNIWEVLERLIPTEGY